MKTRIGEGISGAVFSEDRKYRYMLWRVWNRELPAVIFIGFNPSTADEIQDDPTIVKMAGYSKRWGYGGLYVGNLFALVSPEPIDVLIRPGLAKGDENDHYLEELRHVAGIVVVGWGNVGAHDVVTRVRCSEVLKIFRNPVYCLAITKKGQPSHPLYLPDDYVLKEYQPKV